MCIRSYLKNLTSLKKFEFLKTFNGTVNYSNSRVFRILEIFK